MENHTDSHQQSGRELAVRQPLGDTPPVRSHYYCDVPYPDVMDESGSGGLLEYWHILRRRKGTLLLIAFLGVLAALAYTLPQTPIYQASTTLEIQALNENFLSMGSVNPTTTGNSYYPELDIQTQIKILQSGSLVERALKKFKSEDRSQLVPESGRIYAWRKALGLPQPPPASEKQTALAMATGNLKVRAVGQTRIIEMTCDSTDPNVAARFANTLTNEFIEQNLEARWQTTERTSEFLGRQLEELKIKLEKADERLQSYAAASGLVFTSEKDNVAQQKLQQLQEELSEAQAERMATQSRYEMAATSPPESLPDVLDDSSLRDYQGKLTDLRRAKAELTSSLTPAHPRVKKIDAQIETLKAALENERANILRRIRNDFDAAKRREKLLENEYAAQSKLVTEQSAKLAHYNILKREGDTTRELYETMLQKVKEAGVVSAMRASNIRVVDPAAPPSDPHKPDIFRNSMLGVLAGLVFGVAFVLIRERADRSIQAPGDTAFYLNVPELGAIPSAEREKGRRSLYYRKRSLKKDETADNRHSRVELVTWQQKPSLQAESFRATLASILFSGENGNRPRVMVLTSASPGEGKTTVATNLALALAEIKRRVLLIDADLRKPRLHEIFHLPNEWGLSDALLDKKPPGKRESVVIGTGCQGLYLLPAGTETANIASLLHSPQMPALLKQMRRAFDTILIDSPPMLHIPDARVLGRMADGVILVVQSNKTTRDTAVAAAQRFLEDGTAVIGTVLNHWDPRNAGRYGHGFRYYDNYHRYVWQHHHH